MGYDYYVSTNAWVNKKLFEEYLVNWNNELKIKNQRVLLFLDNFSGHFIDKSKLERIKLEFLPPNLTAFVQPLDAGIIQCFKAIYKRLFLERNIDKIYDLNIGHDFYKITRKEALELIMQAWDLVAAQTIVNYWKKVHWRYRAFDPKSITAEEDASQDDVVDKEDLSEAEAEPEKENLRPQVNSIPVENEPEIAMNESSLSQLPEARKEMNRLQKTLDCAREKAEHKGLRFDFLDAKQYLQLDKALFAIDLPSLDELAEQMIQEYNESQKEQAVMNPGSHSTY